GVAVDRAGNTLITDTANDLVRVIAVSSTNPGYPLAGCAGPCTWTPTNVYTIAGSGTAGYSGDGAAATSAQLNQPVALTVDPEGNTLIGDTTNTRIRALAVSNANPGYALAGCSGPCTWTAGDLYTIAGTGGTSYGDDGVAATNAALDQPFGLAV